MKKLLVVLLFGACVTPIPVTADNTDPYRAIERRLYRQCANEAGGFGSPADCAAIWQTTLNVARSREPAALYDAQARLSPRLCGEREAVGTGNIGWTQHLKFGEHPPAAYPDRWPWRAEHAERLQTLVRRLVRGHERRRPCRGAPVTWGGPDLEADWEVFHYRNRRRARAGLRLLEPLVCEGTRNIFVGFR